MKRRIELVVVLALGIGLGIGLASVVGTASAASGKGVRVSVKEKAALIDVPNAPGSVFVAVGRRSGDASGPTAQVMRPGRTRLCTAGLAGPLMVFEMRASHVFDARRLRWNVCTPQLCVDPHEFDAEDLERTISPRYPPEVCTGGIDEDRDGLIDSQDPECQC